MNKPTHLEYVIGSPIGLAIASCIFGASALQAYLGRLPVVLAFLAWILVVATANAMSKVKRFNDWHRDWEAMADPSRREGRQ